MYFIFLFLLTLGIHLTYKFVIPDIKNKQREREGGHFIYYGLNLSFLILKIHLTYKFINSYIKNK
jgi:hypothetical protein